MTEIEKAYVAGIIDGEGSIMLLKLNKNEFPSSVVSVASTSIELLTYLKEIIGCGKIIQKKNYNYEHHKDCYSYVLTRNSAINLLINIAPFLVINSKIKRAFLTISDYKRLTPRNGRYSKDLLFEKELFYNKFINIT